MKTTMQCPKCQSKDILIIEADKIPLRAARNMIQLGFFSNVVYVTRYVCAACGFSEEWIDDPQSIEKLKNLLK
ncbi:MAG: hypothetical protein KC445_07670 [Anaerolineales bacterium]|nr:hypothetical protein [Anaerolineales bacterium]